jgi:aldose 1-epimerase
VRLQCITYGAAITALATPDRVGASGNVVLGFDTLPPYERQPGYFGAVVGRYANRLARGRFELDGIGYQLACNEGRHHLHGGVRGFDKRVWAAEPCRAGDRAGVRFTRRSLAGEEGYPGALDVSVTYWLSDAWEVTIDYHAVTSAPTIVNLTQHSYFNLSAGAAATITDHALTIRADAIVEVDAELIPTGRLLPVDGTPFDFRAAQAIGARIDEPSPQLRHGGGYDHCWVLAPRVPAALPAAVLWDPLTGRRLEVRTTEPGLQVYSGNRLAARRSAVCLETQHFPDSPAHPHFPSTVLRPGQEYRSVTSWRFGTA